MTTTTPPFGTSRQRGSARRERGLLLPILLLLVGAMAVPAPTAAQVQVQERGAAAEDLRWLPWIGCWEPTEYTPGEGSELLVCITPDRDGVVVESLVDGESLGSDFLAADGSRQDVSEEGCEGTRQASWAADGRRAFLASDLVCGADARRTTRGVFAMGADGLDWIEIQSISTGEGDPPLLSVRRFQAASRATLERHDHAVPATTRGLATETARRSAARALTVEAVAEASERAGPEVTAALVAEMGHGFDLNARVLRDARNQGVDPEVLDMMIAMSYPDRFQIGVDGGVSGVAEAEVASRYDDRFDDGYAVRGSRGIRDHYRCTGWMGRCSSVDLWMATRYGGLGYGYGYRPYGYGYGYGYGSPYGWYSGPRYVVVPPTVPRQERGTMTSEGYRPAATGNTQPRPAARSGTTPQTAPQSAPRPAANPTPATRGGTTTAPPPRPAQRRGTGGGGGL